MDPAVLEGDVARVGVGAGALVAVGAVLRWLWIQVSKLTGWSRVGQIEKKVDDMRRDLEALRKEAIDLAADTNERVARIEGAIDVLMNVIAPAQAQKLRSEQ